MQSTYYSNICDINGTIHDRGIHIGSVTIGASDQEEIHSIGKGVRNISLCVVIVFTTGMPIQSIMGDRTFYP